MKTTTLLPSAAGTLHLVHQPATALAASPDMAPMISAASRVKDGTILPLEGANILRDLRARRDILNLLFPPPHTNPVARTLSLINLEDTPFKMVLGGEVPLDHAIAVSDLIGRGVPPDSEMQIKLLEQFKDLETEGEPQVIAAEAPAGAADRDEFTAAYRAAHLEKAVRDAMNELAETVKAQRTFDQPYWGTGVVLSWIALRDQGRICQFEDHHSWRHANWYADKKAWKVSDPGTELIGALADGRLRASEQIDLGWKSISQLFDMDLAFTRSDILSLWPTRSDPEKRPGARERWDWQALRGKQAERLRVCPETSRGIAKFSEHEAD
jgi:hypothetical protein